MRMHASVAALVVGTALALSACDRTPVPPTPKLALSPESVVLALRGAVHLSAVVTGTAGDSVVNYGSTDTAVVRVDYGTGTVVAVGYGSAWVRAWVVGRPGLMDSVRVSVPEPAGPWLVLRPDTETVLLGWPGQVTWRVGNASDTTVRLASSDTAVLDARASGLLCPRKLGSAVVRGSLAAYPTVTDSMRVRVVPGHESPPPTVSIATITDSAGKAVDLTAVRGTIRVSLNVDTPPWRCLPPFVLELRFDGKTWQRSSEYDWGELRTYTFTVDTRAVDAAGLPLLPNGTHTLGVTARSTDGVVWMTTSQAIVVAN